MSDQLFKASKAKRTRGGFTVSTAGGSDIVKRLRKLENGGQVAIERTVSDFKTRAPAWVTKAVREHYGVDASAVREAAMKPRRGKTSIKVAGITVDGATLEYKGRTLTPVHFKMSPKRAPEGKQRRAVRIPGQAIAGGSPVAMIQPPKAYKVKATIIKGKRVSLPHGTFITSANNATLPFQRTSEKRYPIEAVRTLSVPQMIDGRAHDAVYQKMSEELGKRFEHHVQQAMKP